MALQFPNMSALRPVKVPNPLDRLKTLADFRAMQQQEQLRGLQIQEAQTGMQQQQASLKQRQEQGMAIAQIFEESPDIETAIDKVLKIPNLDPGLAKGYLDVLNSQRTAAKTASDIQTAELTRQEKEQKNAETFAESQNFESAYQDWLQQNQMKPSGFNRQKFRGVYSQLATPRTQNIDPLSPEGIQARIAFEEGQAKIPKPQTPVPGRDVPLSPEVEEQRRRMNPPSTQRGLVPVVIQTPEGPQLLNRETGTAEPIQSGGKDVGLTPTSDQRNRASALRNLDPVLNGISELSEKINTGSGLIAKASGAIEKAKARTNYNDDVAEYESLISGFTPMVARAVGHTGVLTEQDVQSVKALFPKPGDSKTLRDRKIAQIKRILSAVQSVDSAQPEASSGGVIELERGPDGKLRPKK